MRIKGENHLRQVDELGARDSGDNTHRVDADHSQQLRHLRTRVVTYFFGMLTLENKLPLIED